MKSTMEVEGLLAETRAYRGASDTCVVKALVNFQRLMTRRISGAAK